MAKYSTRGASAAPLPTGGYADKWWHTDVIYQIYPKSFYDTTGSGEGDINGITEKLDYLKYLGIGAVWICPVFESPNVDNGYDISDYKAIQKQFGTLEQMKTLIHEAHKRGIKIVMDLVANHSSNQHLWFVRANQGDKTYKDYYIWQPNKGKEPNNWGSFFGGSAWHYNSQQDEYYLGLFTPQQPDLNWRNPKVRNEIYAIMDYWMGLGVDGWRLDAVSHIAKPKHMGNYISKQKYVIGAKHGNGKELHGYMQEMNRKVLSKYPNSIAIGEANLVPPKDAQLFTDPKRKELNMLFSFDHMGFDRKAIQGGSLYGLADFDLVGFKENLAKWQDLLFERGWNTLFLSNHDQARCVSRFGDDKEFRNQSAKMMALSIHLLQGTPFIYQGEEIGMTNTTFNSIANLDDIEARQSYDAIVVQSKTLTHNEFMAAINRYGRDHARTPMQWDSSQNAGFTQGKPWLRVNSRYKEINVETDLSSNDSIIEFYRKLIALRKTAGVVQGIITYGKFVLLDKRNPKLFAYERVMVKTSGVPPSGNLAVGNKILVLANYSNQSYSWRVPFPMDGYKCTVLISSYATHVVQPNPLDQTCPQRIPLRAYEGVALLLEPTKSVDKHRQTLA